MLTSLPSITDANENMIDDAKSFVSEPLDNSKATNLIITKNLEKKPSFCIEGENAPCFPHNEINTLDSKVRSDKAIVNNVKTSFTKKSASIDDRKDKTLIVKGGVDKKILALDISNKIPGFSSFFKCDGSSKDILMHDENSSKNVPDQIISPLIYDNVRNIDYNNVIKKNFRIKDTALSHSDIQKDRITIEKSLIYTPKKYKISDTSDIEIKTYSSHNWNRSLGSKRENENNLKDIEKMNTIKEIYFFNEKGIEKDKFKESLGSSEMKKSMNYRSDEDEDEEEIEKNMKCNHQSPKINKQNIYEKTCLNKETMMGQSFHNN